MVQQKRIRGHRGDRRDDAREWWAGRMAQRHEWEGVAQMRVAGWNQAVRERQRLSWLAPTRIPWRKRVGAWLMRVGGWLMRLGANLAEQERPRRISATS